MTHDRAPFWSDDFDMDLLKVLPDAPTILGELGDVLLYTHGHETHGRLNHPSVWNGDRGMFAFFGTAREGFKPAGYATDSPIVECTVLEAFRDAWPHHYMLFLNDRLVWDTSNGRLFLRILYHRRAQQPLMSEHRAEQLTTHLRHSLAAAERQLGAVIAVARAQET